jgi:RNA polymerase sigma-70 factor (ECF subfamily)
VGSLADADLPPPAPSSYEEEQLLMQALHERDEAAFALLLDRYYSPLLRLARSYVRSRDEAEEVVQETWLAVLSGLGRFQGRSSLKTWIFRILVNRARTRAKREARTLPFSSLAQPAGAAAGNREAFNPEWPFHSGSAAPLSWHGQAWEPPDPEEALLANELNATIDTAIETLPPQQQEVITLRDLEGWTAREVCDLLEITEANQRVLLHRARKKVREALDAYFAPPDPGDSPASYCMA